MRSDRYPRDEFNRYFTGKPCIRDHIAKRSGSNGVCIECAALRSTYSPEKKIRKRNSYRAKLPTPTRPEPEACECCSRPPGYHSLCLDHNHLTFTFRGWLCTRCNKALGLLDDSIEGVQRALDYLKRNS